MAKRYYWLKLQKDFFKSLRIKRLRKLAGGDTYTIIYLKLQLLALNTDGILSYKGVFDSFEEEISEEIDEDIDNVKVTIQFLLASGLMVQSDDEFVLPFVKENTGSETPDAQRKRIERTKVGQIADNVRLCPTEKEIDIDKDIEIDINRAKSKRFVPPSVDEVKDYCLERGNNVDAEAFCDFYNSKGWMVGKNKMKDWKSAVRTWERNRKPTVPKAKNQIDWDSL